MPLRVRVFHHPCAERVEIRAWTRDIYARQDSSDLYGVELRITKDGELYLSEVFHDRRKMHARSMELFEKLVAKMAGRQLGRPDSPLFVRKWA